MALFPYAHATHPHWPMAVGLVLAQIKAHMASAQYADAPTLGVLYVTDNFAAHAQDILDALQVELPTVTDWVGSVGLGVVSNNAEYWDEPALAVMLLDVPHHHYRVFSGVTPLGGDFVAHTALVHGDAHTQDPAELVRELAANMQSGQLFGGFASCRADSFQLACSSRGTTRGSAGIGNVLQGGLSGVAFGPGIRTIHTVSQGCQPLGTSRTVTDSDHNLVLALDGQPALDVMFNDLRLDSARPQDVLDEVRTTLVGLVRPEDAQWLHRVVPQVGPFQQDATVRQVIGLDPARRGVAVAAAVVPSTQLVFCKRDRQSARLDLVRVCTEVREALESQEAELDLLPKEGAQIAGAIYVSCTARGGGAMGPMGAEMQLVQRALGDVPVVGFYAAGEIGHHHIYSYTGVLTVFLQSDDVA